MWSGSGGSWGGGGKGGCHLLTVKGQEEGGREQCWALQLMILWLRLRWLVPPRSVFVLTFSTHFSEILLTSFPCLLVRNPMTRDHVVLNQ